MLKKFDLVPNLALLSQSIVIVLVIVVGVSRATAGEPFPGSVPLLSLPDYALPLPTAEEDITARVKRHPEPLAPPNGPALPASPKPQLQGRVIDLSKVPKSDIWELPPVFYWPDPGAFGEAAKSGVPFKVVEEDWDSHFTQWMRYFVSIGQQQSPKIRYFAENDYVSYLEEEKNGTQVILRAIRGRRNKLPDPVQLQMVRDSTHSENNLKELLTMLPGWCGTGSLSESGLPLLVDVIDNFPLSQKLKGFTWQLQSYGFDSLYRVVKINLTVKRDDLPPVCLQLAIGPCGDLLVLSGLGLQMPERTTKDRRLPEPRRIDGKLPGT